VLTLGYSECTQQYPLALITHVISVMNRSIFPDQVAVSMTFRKSGKRERSVWRPR